MQACKLYWKRDPGTDGFLSLLWNFKTLRTFSHSCFCSFPLTNLQEGELCLIIVVRNGKTHSQKAMHMQLASSIVFKCIFPKLSKIGNKNFIIPFLQPIKFWPSTLCVKWRWLAFLRQIGSYYGSVWSWHVHILTYIGEKHLYLPHKKVKK